MEPKRDGINSSTSRINLRYSKKGQVTIFIIVGIILLVTAAALFFIFRETVTERLTAEGEPVIAQVPVEFQPIKSYTENCLTDVGKRGLLVLGEQGGYIYPNLVGQYSSSDPTDADGLDLEPLKVPYWHYNKEPNKGNKIVFSSLQPKLYAKDDPEMSIEAQLARFVNERIDECLDDYRPFLTQGYSVEAFPPDATVKVSDESVNFWLKMDVSAKRGEAKQELEQFYVRIPLKLKQYYEVAEQITKAEQNYSFLERQGLDLIAVYSGVDSEKLPPTEAWRFDLIPTAFWTELNVKEKVTSLLISQVPLLRYLGSSNFYRYDYQHTPGAIVDLQDLYQKNYDNTILPLEGAEDVQVSFDYFGWEPFVDLNDKAGNVEPRKVSVSYSVVLFNTQQYYTTYDLSYPVLITIRNPQAFNGEGFQFVFGLEANIRNNEIAEADQVALPPVARADRSLVCDEDKRNTQLLKTVIVDSFTKEPLPSVQIGFSIPNQDDCIIGVTDKEGELESTYPAVYGGVGSYLKEEYLTSFYPLDTYRFKKASGMIGSAVADLPSRVIELHKIKPIAVSIKKKSLQKCIDKNLLTGPVVNCFTQGLLSSSSDPVYSYQPQMLDSTHSWVFVNAPQQLEETETANIVLTRVADTNPLAFNNEFSAAVVIKGEQVREVDLVPGVYEVSALLTNEKKVVIPEEERCTGGLGAAIFCVDIDGCCITFDETVLDKLLQGQASWNKPETYLTITPEQLYGSSEVTLYLLAFDLENVPEKEHVRILEDMQVMGQLGNLSGQPSIRSALEPTFR